MRYVELLRHPDNDGDRLSPDGVAAAEEIGRNSLHPPYAFFASTGAARAVQTAEILRHAADHQYVPVFLKSSIAAASAFSSSADISFDCSILSTIAAYLLLMNCRSDASNASALSTGTSS